jgi:hypothetical protein
MKAMASKRTSMAGPLTPTFRSKPDAAGEYRMPLFAKSDLSRPARFSLFHLRPFVQGLSFRW